MQLSLQVRASDCRRALCGERQDPNPPRASGHRLQTTTVTQGRDTAFPEPADALGLQRRAMTWTSWHSEESAGSPGAPVTRRALLRHSTKPEL